MSYITLAANLLPEKENEATVAMMAKRERTLANILMVRIYVIKLCCNVESPRLQVAFVMHVSLYQRTKMKMIFFILKFPENSSLISESFLRLMTVFRVQTPTPDPDPDARPVLQKFEL
jgi:hypothetical protein